MAVGSGMQPSLDAHAPRKSERDKEREREKERDAEREREKRESFGVSLNIGGLSLLGDHLIVVLQCKREYPHH